MLLASLTSSVTDFVGHHGVYAVFALMLVAAVLPIGSELVMLYAGAVASGSLGVSALVFGAHASPLAAYVAFVVAAVAGNVLGAAVGYKIGAWGGRPFVERYGRFIHVTPAKLERTEAWFERYELVAVPIGFAAPLVRSFVAIPAGIVAIPFARFLVGAFIGCTVFALTLGGIGWAAGSSYAKLHGNLRYVDAAVVVALAILAGWWAIRRRRATTLAPRGDDSAH
jgi:membrane protein DedA with SNARE-associated domain